MLLVERHALNDAIVKGKNVISTSSGSFPKNKMDSPETRGLCLSEELTIASVGVAKWASWVGLGDGSRWVWVRRDTLKKSQDKFWSGWVRVRMR
ncbi:putative protein DA1 [Helianthus anomalus]